MGPRARPKLTSEDVATYAAALRALAPFDDQEIAMGLEVVGPRELHRGEHLLRAGDPAIDVSVVVRGLAREYFLMEGGIERTKAFVLAGHITGSLADLISGAPSMAYIVVDEPTRVLTTSYARYRELAARSAAWARLGRSALERILLRKAEREYELLGLDAGARYEVFRRRFPGLESRVAARHVASYLGITPVHLSRLRKARRQRSRARSATG